jgi:DNA replication protein DnaC
MTAIDPVRKISHELRLFGVHEALAARAEQAVSRNLHPLEFLHLVLEDEKLYRHGRLAKSLTTRAKFRHAVDVEDWDSSYDRGISSARMKELLALSFFHAKENLLLLGKTGEGKTHLAIAIGRRLCDNAQSVAFLPMQLLFEEVLAARTAGKLLGFLTRLNQTKVLILDDFGLRNYTHDEATILVELLEGRSRKGPVVVTSQVDPNGWYKLFEDPVIAEAIVDRLKSPSLKIQLKGGSYRERLPRSVKIDCQKNELMK